MEIIVDYIFYVTIIFLLCLSIAQLYGIATRLDTISDAVVSFLYSDISKTPSTASVTTTTVINKVTYPAIKCNITQAKLYFSPACPHCQRQLTDGTYDSLIRSGVNIELKDVTRGNYNITAVPDWFVNGKDNYGYRTWEQLKELFECIDVIY